MNTYFHMFSTTSAGSLDRWRWREREGERERYYIYILYYIYIRMMFEIDKYWKQNKTYRNRMRQIETDRNGKDESP